MSFNLEPLRLAGLTNMEAGQLIRRHLEDLSAIDQEVLTDAPFLAYVQKMSLKMVDYEKALAQIRKNEETEKIFLADKDRDKAVDAFGKVLKLYALSDDPDEVEASRRLSIVFDSLGNLPDLNYEAETLAIDKLVNELQSPAHTEKVSKLNIDRYIVRMKTTNEAFKVLFNSRIIITASTDLGDMKTIRKELMGNYSDFAAYVLAMAKALETPLFIQALNLLNTGRKYYSDLLARRNGNKEGDKKPAEQPNNGE